MIALSEVDATKVDLVGGKAAGLGELIRAGERVPDGFCLTTEVSRAGTVPEAELVDAYRRLCGGANGRVAVRSSATAEDLPGASFAGQQDTYLNVSSAAELIEAVGKCWESLRSERAIAYREANDIDHDAASMAVVVQRMIDPVAAGVMFTANPITGTRTETVVDAVAGLGTAVVDGSAAVDHYVLGERTSVAPHGCLDRPRLDALRAAGQRVQKHFGSPQDVEWAIDAEGVLWLLQSRPVTTLFPQPPDTGLPQPRVLMEVGHMQGMLRPFTPMGMSAMKVATAIALESYGVKVDPADGLKRIVDVGGRMYIDFTDLVRSRLLRKRLPEAMKVYGYRVSAAVERVLEDPRFAAQPGLPFRVRSVVAVLARVVPGSVAGLVWALARPSRAGEKMFVLAAESERLAATPAGVTSAAERLRWSAELQSPVMSGAMLKALPALWAGMLASRAPTVLLKGIATDGEIASVLSGMPHNVTTEMDLALWRLASAVGPHRELLLNTAPDELAARYRQGTLPDIGLGAFLATYGHRAAAEVDIGVPRWAEDPTLVFATIANYLRVTDPEQAPDRKFEQAAERAEATIDELIARARRSRPVRARLAGFLMRRARALAGLRELPKFIWLYSLAEMRRQILLAGAELAGRGLLDRAEDIVFLDLREAEAVAGGEDLRELVASRRASYARETKRRNVPGVLLSDGTIPEALAPPVTAEDGTLVGMPAAPGRATGRARVIHDPAGAYLEPGEILVAATTDPGWTPLFMTAGGLVTETGAPMAHGPTVAREYGIPAVICVRDATETIRTGELITIDGAAGTVRRDADVA
ncbi:PEP/pyruvate-binding domain-containing protein [Saccharopolyspora taberi]|uniref:PEP/pyruvate-binding domain-containing protein n=1 Tax=Saccharopolyspora taberi TaxID=60895 RepID=UPI0031E3400A